MAISNELYEFHQCTFEEMVDLIVELREKIEELEDTIETLQDTENELMGLLEV